MNKENAHLYLPLVQALADGKTIQVKQNGIWKDCSDLNLVFGFEPHEYRIKPEPRTWEIWAHENDKDIMLSIPTSWNTDNTWKRITVQEVLE
jgi:hypothetical protein